MDAKYIRCAAKCCGNKLLDRSDLTFFTFPEDDNLAKIWAKYANIKSHQYGSVLCSEHFDDMYFDHTYGKKSVFKQNVQPIPTIFNKKMIKTDDENTATTMANITDIQTEKVSDVPPLDFFEHCRLCATQMPARSLISLFNTSNNFKELIDICLPGKVSISDNLPHAICKSCSENLISCASILQKFKDADKKLRTLHPTPSTSKERPKKEAVINRVINISDSEEETDTELIEAINELDDEETDNVLEFLENVNKILEKIVPDDIDEFDKADENDFDTTDEIFDTDIVPQRQRNKVLTKNDILESSPIKTNIVESSVESQAIKKDVIKFKCISCPQVYESKDKIMLHAFHDHPETRGNKVISTIIKASAWVKQNETLPSAKIYQCAVCDIKLKSQESVIRHTKLNHKHITSDKLLVKVTDPQLGDIIKHMCVNCPKLFDTKRDAQFHGYFDHPKSKIISRTIVVKRGKNNVSLVAPLLEQDLNAQISRTFHSLFQNDTIPSINCITSRARRYEALSEPLQTFHIKYKCKTCPDIFKTYKEVLDHYTEKHLELPGQTGPLALVVKIKNSGNTDDNTNDIITIDDGTIKEVDPSTSENRPKSTKLITTMKYKCLKCPKLCQTKQQIIQHNVSAHPSPDSKEIKCKIVSVTKKSSNLIHRNFHERYECLICCSLHTTKFSIVHHTRLLHPEVHKHKFLYRLIESKTMKFEPLQCLRCNVLPLNYSRYRKHMLKHVCFPCETCGSKFTKIIELREHIKKKHDKKPTDTTEPEIHKCIVCEQEFESKSELLKHEKEHKVPKDVQCIKCNKRFNSEYELKKHEKNHHETCLCHECGKTYEKPYIRQHLQTHNKDCPFKCKMVNCTREFKTQSSLFRHQRAHVRKNTNTICQICGKIVSRSSLTLHMKIHSVVRNEVCDICGAAFYRKDHLRHHRKRHTQIENPRENATYQCPLCNITLQNKKAYMSHVTITHGIEQPEEPKRNKQPEKNLSCVLCDKKFAFRCYLEDHYRQHRGERAHKCDVCNKAFATRIVLYQHKLTHLPYEQLRHQCDICDRKFRRHGQLVDHRRVHTGEKPFPCPVCKRPFRVRGEMVKHMRIHTRNDSARTMRLLKRHLPPPPASPPVEESSEDSQEASKENTSSSEQMVIAEKKPRVVNKIIRQNNTIFLIQEDSSSLEQFGDHMPSLD